MSRADVVFHGHFYQPPRENPWTDVVEREWSADPFHDWNERIAHECYAANAASAVYDAQGQLEAMLDNYEWISFNFGPTLLRWMETEDPRTLERIVEADRRSRLRLGGHGNALAQCYNHVILPLADARDRRTQIRWGCLEFLHRFGRPPEGMWLAETAANHEVLEELIEQQIRFVVLAPRQAARIRMDSSEEWIGVEGGVDPSRAYRYCSRRPSGGTLGVFFYDGALGAACSFGRALSDGRALADAFEAAFDPSRDHRQLLHVAVDGETAGHHVPWGNLALSWALARELPARGFRLTNYGQYLEENPPEVEVELDLGPLGEGSSWSCAHGVGRWIRDCSCRIAPGAPTSQAWRTPLREALDLIRDRSREVFEEQMSELVADPWKARDEYVELLLDPSPEARDRFWARHGLVEEMDAAQRRRLWTLLEMQHQAQLMYTSCAWFFDDLAGLEAVQILRYAARCLELFDEVGVVSPRAEFLDRLREAQTNEDPPRNGAEVFERDVESVRVTAERVVAHLAMLATLRPPEASGSFGLWDYHREQFHLRQKGELRLVTGRFRLQHRRTESLADLQVAMVHRGGIEFCTAVRPFDEAGFVSMQQAMHEAFDSSGEQGLIAELDHHFQMPRYGVEDLLEPGYQQFLAEIFSSVTEVFGESNARLYDEYRSLLHDLRELGWELPDELQSTIAFALRRRLEARLLRWVEHPDLEEDPELLHLVRELHLHRAQLVSPTLTRAFALQVEEAMDAAARSLGADGFDSALEGLKMVLRGLRWVEELGLEVDLRPVQTRFVEEVHPRMPRPYPSVASQVRAALHFSPQLEE